MECLLIAGAQEWACQTMALVTRHAPMIPPEAMLALAKMMTVVIVRGFFIKVLIREKN